MAKESFIALPPGTPDPKVAYTPAKVPPAFSVDAIKMLDAAVRSKKLRCHMDNRAMNIRYGRERVFVKPADGSFVPCGEFSYDTLKKARDGDLD